MYSLTTSGVDCLAARMITHLGSNLAAIHVSHINKLIDINPDLFTFNLFFVLLQE